MFRITDRKVSLFVEENEKNPSIFIEQLTHTVLSHSWDIKSY